MALRIIGNGRKHAEGGKPARWRGAFIAQKSLHGFVKCAKLIGGRADTVLYEKPGCCLPDGAGLGGHGRIDNARAVKCEIEGDG